MRIALPALGAIISLCLASSCTIQKRIYMSGYHIEWRAVAKTLPRLRGPQVLGYSLNAYNALSTKASQETLIDAANPVTIQGREGTVLCFPPDAFVYEDGSKIRCSQVAVFLTEFYALSDIVASGLTTTNHRRMLASAGMVYIEARCHGEKLKLKPGKKLTLRMPAFPADANMKAFSGKLSNGIVDWKVDGKLKTDNFRAGSPDPETGAEGEGRSEGEYQESYIMSMTSLGWINCDRFYDTPDPVKFLVKADSISNTSVALVFRDIKSVLPGYQLSNLSTEFTGIPKGAAVTVLAYRIDPKSKEVVVGQQDFAAGDTAVVKLAMQAMSADEFKALLKGFD